MSNLPNAKSAPFDQVVAIMAQLRGEKGCPWDKKQTHTSLGKYLIEETYEVIDAIEAGDMQSLREELGDVLLQVVFHAQLASEAGIFTIHDVARTLADKLIRRHPHVFGNGTAANEDDVLKVWQSVKQQERDAQGADNDNPSLMDGIPRHLPALMFAEAVGQRAARVGFDWDGAADVVDKVHEEQAELAEALAELEVSKAQDAESPPGAMAQVTEEWGDLAFALVNLARHLKIEPEAALRQATHKFEQRFRIVEQLAGAEHLRLEDMTLGQMDALWERAKGMQE